MKHYKIPGPNETGDVPISDHGAVFVFIVSRAELINIWQTTIWLTFSPKEGFYIGMFVPTKMIATQHLPDRKGTSKRIPHDFEYTNIVVKLVISFAGYSIYVNGVLRHTSNEKVTVTRVALRTFPRSDNPQQQRAGLQGTLLIFEEAEKDEAERIAQAMQNGNIDEAINQSDPSLREDQDGAFDTFKKSLEQRELKVIDMEKALIDREGALEKREKMLELCLSELDARTHCGSSGHSDHTSNGDPPDAEVIRLSATQAWPKAVKYVLKDSGYTSVKAKHDMLIKKWLEARGHTILPNSYDYFIYSLGVVWPKAVHEFTGDVEFAKIRGKQEEYMDLLVDSTTFPDHV